MQKTFIVGMSGDNEGPMCSLYYVYLIILILDLMVVFDNRT